MKHRSLKYCVMAIGAGLFACGPVSIAHELPQAAVVPRHLDDDDHKADGVSDGARLEAEGKGPLSYRCKRDGRVFIQDVHDRRLVVKTTLYEGEEIAIDPKGDTITIDGKPIPGPKRLQKLANDHKHRIYFDPDNDRKDDKRKHDRDRDRDTRY